jgi:hypothetical protein
MIRFWNIVFARIKTNQIIQSKVSSLQKLYFEFIINLKSIKVLNWSTFRVDSIKRN